MVTVSATNLPALHKAWKPGSWCSYGKMNATNLISIIVWTFQKISIMGILDSAKY